MTPVEDFKAIIGRKDEDRFDEGSWKKKTERKNAWKIPQTWFTIFLLKQNHETYAVTCVEFKYMLFPVLN